MIIDQMCVGGAILLLFFGKTRVCMVVCTLRPKQEGR